jgi:uncharacterized membrane protein YhdT
MIRNRMAASEVERGNFFKTHIICIPVLFIVVLRLIVHKLMYRS